LISWDISPTWQLQADPAHAREVEVTFIPEGGTGRASELKHRHLERHGAGWESVRDGGAERGGWPLYLQRYVDTAAA